MYEFDICPSCPRRAVQRFEEGGYGRRIVVAECIHVNACRYAIEETKKQIRRAKTGGDMIELEPVEK